MPLPLAILLVASAPAPALAPAMVRWERLPADLRSMRYPPILQLASFSFTVEFDAAIRDRHFVRISHLKGPKVLVPVWALDSLPCIVLGEGVRVTTGHFRLCLDLQDTHVDQQVVPL